jgi:hypothetical protein
VFPRIEVVRLTYNMIRPHEALGVDIRCDVTWPTPLDHPEPNLSEPETVQES